MASTLQASSFFFFFILLLLLSYAATEVVARKSTPKDSKKQPQTVFNDGTVLVPGLGRYMLPKAGGGFRSLDYNPITGDPGWNGVSIRGIAGPNGKHNYIPGLDDTIFPNPGVEFPNPFRPTPNP